MPNSLLVYFFLHPKKKCRHINNGILLPKLFWPIVRKMSSSDQENLLKFEAEGWEFAKLFDMTRTFFFKQWKVRIIFGKGGFKSEDTEE